MDYLEDDMMRSQNEWDDIRDFAVQTRKSHHCRTLCGTAALLVNQTQSFLHNTTPRYSLSSLQHHMTALIPAIYLGIL